MQLWSGYALLTVPEMEQAVALVALQAIEAEFERATVPTSPTLAAAIGLVNGVLPAPG